MLQHGLQVFERDLGGSVEAAAVEIDDTDAAGSGAVGVHAAGCEIEAGYKGVEILEVDDGHVAG